MTFMSKALIAVAGLSVASVPVLIVLSARPYPADKVLPATTGAPTEVQIEGHGSPIAVRPIGVRGHNYLVFAAKSPSEGFSVVHDPACGQHGE